MWREVQTHIKGSLAAVRSGRGRLGRAEYVALSELRREGELSGPQREQLYTAFE